MVLPAAGLYSSTLTLSINGLESGSQFNAIKHVSKVSTDHKIIQPLLRPSLGSVDMLNRASSGS